MSIGNKFSAHHRIISAFKRVEFVSDVMSYMRVVPRGRLYSIIVLNVHKPSWEKVDDLNDSLCEKFEQVFCHFRKYHMKILLGDLM